MSKSPAEPPLSREERLRRVVILCSNFTMNFAYRREGWQFREAWEGQFFWITVANNFLDQCVLDWCKLFTDRRQDKDGKFHYGEHHWKTVVTDADQAAFEQDLRSSVRTDFDKLVRDMTRYRNRFVAHLDADREMHLRRLASAWGAVHVFNRYAWQEKPKGKSWCLPADLHDLFDRCRSSAKRVYQQIAASDISR